MAKARGRHSKSQTSTVGPPPVISHHQAVSGHLYQASRAKSAGELIAYGCRQIGSLNLKCTAESSEVFIKAQDLAVETGKSDEGKGRDGFPVKVASKLSLGSQQYVTSRGF